MFGIKFNKKNKNSNQVKVVKSEIRFNESLASLERMAATMSAASGSNLASMMNDRTNRTETEVVKLRKKLAF